MIEIKFIRQNLSLVQKALEARGHQMDLGTFKTCDEDRRNILQELETLRHQRNVVSDRIAEMKKGGVTTDALVAEMREVSSHIKELDKNLAVNKEQMDAILLGLPNIPHPTVPTGKDESDNPVIKTFGVLPEFDFDPQPHWDVGTHLKILDFDRASRITGARFPLYFGAGARLERALINFMLDVHINEHGYQEVLPPFMVNRQSMTHTGQLPKFEEDLFKLSGWDYYLIPTAEVPVTNIHQDETLNAD
ncbi:MAG: serine--tRNA ligase, partial [Desulfobacterales bacterium]